MIKFVSYSLDSMKIFSVFEFLIPVVPVIALHFADGNFSLAPVANFLKAVFLKLAHEKCRYSLQMEHLISSLSYYISSLYTDPIYL